MARITQYVCDISGEVIEPTEVEIVRFTIGGTEYHFETGAKSRTEFKKALGKWIKIADETADENGVGPNRRPVGQAVRNAPAANEERREWQQRVRTWGQQNGHKVSDRGRIAQSVIDAYLEANPEDPEPQP